MKVLTKKVTTKKVQHEALEQEALFTWACMQKKKYPELELLFAVPNGGSRNKFEAFNLKKQGVKSGVPDVCLPVRRGTYGALYIEMKSKKGKPSDNQKIWIELSRKYGNKVEVCYDWESAKNVIVAYLDLNLS